VKSCVLYIADFCRSHHVVNVGARPVVSVWTNYSGLPTEPGRRANAKIFVPTVPAVQSLRSVQIVETHRVGSRRFNRFDRLNYGRRRITASKEILKTRPRHLIPHSRGLPEKLPSTQ
jgi:hypothetical protein